MRGSDDEVLERIELAVLGLETGFSSGLKVEDVRFLLKIIERQADEIRRQDQVIAKQQSKIKKLKRSTDLDSIVNQINELRSEVTKAIKGLK